MGRGLASLAAAFAVLVATPAVADYRADYKAYGEAIARGDLAAALRHGEAAWRAAEKELGESKTTAILAFNFAELAVIDTPAAAIEPYRRAEAISAKMETGLVKEDVAAGLAYAVYVGSPDDADLRTRLEVALNTRRAAKLPASPVSGYGWRALAARSDNTPDMRRFADRAVEDAEALGGEQYDRRLLREALVLSGTALTIGVKQTADELERAVSLLDRAVPMFPAQADIIGFDPMLARAIALRSLFWDMAKSSSWRRRLQKSIDDANEDFAPAVKWASGLQSCAYKWRTMPGPNYSSEGRAKPKVGTLLIGYDTKGLKVDRARVLFFSSNADFARAALQAVKAWELKSPADPSCEKNTFAVFQFSFL